MQSIQPLEIEQEEIEAGEAQQNNGHFELERLVFCFVRQLGLVTEGKAGVSQRHPKHESLQVRRSGTAVVSENTL